MTDVVTPNAHRVWRKHIRFEFAELRGELRNARALRASGSVLDMEDAAGILAMAHHRHIRLQESVRGFRATKVVKYANLSDAAAAREPNKHNGSRK